MGEYPAWLRRTVIPLMAEMFLFFLTGVASLIYIVYYIFILSLYIVSSRGDGPSC